MPVLSSDLLSSTLTGSRKIFNDTFQAGMDAAPWLKICLDGRAQDSAGHESMQYGWLFDIPKMSRWKGELEVGDLVGADFTLVNHLHTAAFSVDRLALERDQLGMIGPKTRQLADEALRFIGEEIYTLVNGGGAVDSDSPVFDDAAFFGSSRTIGDSAVIDNTLATNGTSAANFRTDLAEATAAMMKFQDSRGRPINRAPNVILIPPDDQAAAWEALATGPGAEEPGVPPASGDGVVVWTARGYTVIVSAYITDTGGRYFLHVSPGWAPFLFQQEVPPMIEGITSTDSESAVLREQFVYKVRGSFAVGYGDPLCAIYTT